MKRLWRQWKRVAQVIGNFQARLLFTVFYFLLVTPIAVPFKVLADPLTIKRRRQSLWHPVPPDPSPWESSHRQS